MLTGLLVAATVASAAYQVASVLMARRWRRTAPLREEGAPRRGSTDRPAWSGEPLPVSVLKPLHGAEPHLEESLATFFAQDHPRYELLFGVADPDDPAADRVRALVARFPEVRARLVPTRADLGPNRKVCNLHGLAAAARHGVLLVSDSDMRVTPDYLRRIVAPFHDPGVGLVTAPYRGTKPDGLAAALEALGIAASFMPGVFLAVAGGVPFASGSTIALQRASLEAIGGFEGLVDYLADDYQMGKRVTDLGLRVHLSSFVVDSVLGRRSLGESWSRRLRWARTVRACRPWGHLGSGLTHTTALAVGLMIADRGSPIAVGIATGAFAVRVLAAWQVAVATLGSGAARRWFLLLPISDLVETALWLCSFFGRTVLWRGQRYRLTEGGRIERTSDTAGSSG